MLRNASAEFGRAQPHSPFDRRHCLRLRRLNPLDLDKKLSGIPATGQRNSVQRAAYSGEATLAYSTISAIVDQFAFF